MISVVIPTYNAAAFIEATLASAFAQSTPPGEIVVVDDCSKDNTAAVVERLIADAPCPVKLLKTESNSGGPARPMNIGIAAARGAWIVTLDHDDQLTPDRIANLEVIIQDAEPCGAIIGRMDVADAADPRSHLLDAAWQRVQSLLPQSNRTVDVHIVPPEIAWAALAEFGCYAMSCSAMAFPKVVWTAVGGFDDSVRTCIDFAFLEAALRDRPLGVVDTVVALWRHLPTNLSHDFRRRVRDISHVMQRFHNRFEKLPPRLTPQLRKELLQRADLLAALDLHSDAWRAWRQCVRQYGARAGTLTTAMRLAARRAGLRRSQAPRL
jgi:hypothetical protein